MKKLLPMFLVAVSFCLISCGNKANNETDMNATPEVTIETSAETQNLDENNAVDENNDVSTTDNNAAGEETVSPEVAE